MSIRRQIVIQLNEFDFDLYAKYRGLDRFEDLTHLGESKITRFGRTTSEADIRLIEPWIQWVSFYHGVDAKTHGVEHLWDLDRLRLLKDKHLAIDGWGAKGIGVYGSMNFLVDSSSIEFFDAYIPDPWAPKSVKPTAEFSMLHRAISRLVLQNSKGIDFKAFGLLLFSITSHIGFRKLCSSLITIAKFFFSPVIRSLGFDYLFLKLAVDQILKRRSGLSLIFLNSAAHIQHHNYKSSKFLHRSRMSKNGDVISHLMKEIDILWKEVDILVAEGYSVSIVTGLSQEVYEPDHIYWRIRDPKAFLLRLFKHDIQFCQLMSRDLKLYYTPKGPTLEEMRGVLEDLSLSNGAPVFGEFDLDPSEGSLFFSVIYFGETSNFNMHLDDITLSFQEVFTRVSLKHSQHNEKGYQLELANSKSLAARQECHPMPVWEILKSMRAQSTE